MVPPGLVLICLPPTTSFGKWLLAVILPTSDANAMRKRVPGARSAALTYEGNVRYPYLPKPMRSFTIRHSSRNPKFPRHGKTSQPSQKNSTPPIPANTDS